METKTDSNTHAIRILVVDDHPNTASTLARALAQLGAGVHVTSATSGQEALTKVKDSAVDILITDMIMPEMTGLELIEKLQNHPGGRPAYTYLVTAYDVPGLKVTANRLKVNDVIIKPVRPERICQIATNAIEEMKHSTKPRATAAGKRKFKILVADDRQDNVTLLARYLEYEGYDQVTAMDGIDALNKVRDELPDLVLLDVNMPNKDGFEVLEDIRADPAIAHTPVIILTAARLEPMDVQSGLNLGADDYVTKPFDRHELMARIRTKLRVKEAEDVIRRQNRELGVLLETTTILSARGNLNEMLDAVLPSIVRHFDAAAGYIVDFENAAKKSFPASSEEIDIVQVMEFLGKPRQGNGAHIINNTQTDIFWQAKLGGKALSAVIIPMSNRLGNLLGALLLTHEGSAWFKAEQIPVLQAIANQAAVAIENADWYASIQDRRVQTRGPYEQER
ncbi:MAG: response regulator [Anaerolineales bacterium]|jgi:CheY-like chemotaxis protein|nr:response regulator [Anaerolineales bacterium]